MIRALSSQHVTVRACQVIWSVRNFTRHVRCYSELSSSWSVEQYRRLLLKCYCYCNGDYGSSVVERCQASVDELRPASFRQVNVLVNVSPLPLHPRGHWDVRRHCCWGYEPLSMSRGSESCCRWCVVKPALWQELPASCPYYYLPHSYSI